MDAMKAECPLFDALYKRIYHSGSYYDGLRVGDSKEFDLNLVLDLAYLTPFLDFNTGAVPGFTKVRSDHGARGPSFVIPQQAKLSKVFDKLSKIFDNQWYLDTKKVREWLQSVMSKVLKAMENKWPKDIKKVRTRCTQGGNFRNTGKNESNFVSGHNESGRTVLEPANPP